MFRKMIFLVLILSFVGCVPYCSGQVTDTTAIVQFTGNGSTTAFAFSFPLPGTDTSQIVVILRTIADGSETTLVETTDYTVSATNNDFSSGGTVTTVATYTSASTITIKRDVPDTQSTALSDTGTLRLKNIETALDKLTMLDIQRQEELNRCLKFPQTDSTSLTSEISDSVSRASSILGFTSTGVPTVFSSFTADTVAVDVFMEEYLTKSNANAANTYMGLGTGDGPTFASLTISGVATLSDNVTMATGKTLTVETVKAVDSTGLLLLEDGGDGMTVTDGGAVTATDDFTITAAATPTFGATDSTNTITTEMSSDDSNGLIGTTTAHGLAVITNNTTKMFLESGGDVGVGITNPTRKFEVSGVAGVEEAELGVIAGEAKKAFIDIWADDGDDAADKWRLTAETNGDFNIETDADGTPVNAVQLKSDGGVTFPSLLQQSDTELVVEYDTTSKEIYAETSVRRDKKNIVYGLPNRSGFADLKVATFENKVTSKPSAGFIAEDVFTVLPEIVVVDSAGAPLGISRGRLIAYMVADAIDRGEEIEQIKARVAVLEGYLVSLHGVSF